jgi:hypothetical protein
MKRLLTTTLVGLIVGIPGIAGVGISVASASVVPLTWAAPAPINFGTALGAAQLDASSSVPGMFSYSPAVGAVLQPGITSLTATFTPSDPTNYAAGSVRTQIAVGFPEACVTTPVNGALTVASGQSICVSTGGEVTGPVTVVPGGALWVSGGVIDGRLRSHGALGLTLCGSTVGGPVTITGSTGPVLFGGPDCEANTFASSVSITNNAGGVGFDDNAVGGRLRIADNSGGVQYSAGPIPVTLTATTTHTPVGNYSVGADMDITVSVTVADGAGVVDPATGAVNLVFDQNGVNGTISTPFINPGAPPPTAVSCSGAVAAPNGVGQLGCSENNGPPTSFSASQDLVPGETIGTVTFAEPGFATTSVPVFFD